MWFPLSFPPIVTSWKVLYGLPCWPWYFLVSAHQLCLTQTYIYYFSSSQEIVFFSDSFFFPCLLLQVPQLGQYIEQLISPCQGTQPFSGVLDKVSLAFLCRIREFWLPCDKNKTLLFTNNGHPMTKYLPL